MAFIKKITSEYGAITLIIGGIIMAVLGFIFNLIFSFLFAGIGILFPALVPYLAIVALIISLWLAGLIAVFVVLSWISKNKKLGGF